MLAISVLALSGCALRGVSAGQKFGDVAIQDIGRDWDAKVLDQYAGADFYKQCPPERAREICSLLKEKLGPLKSYKGSTISPNFPSPTPGSTAPLVMGMKGEAEFEKASGNVTLIVAEHDGRWTLNGFQVQSAALMNVQGAQNGPRPMPPGMKLPPGTQLPPGMKLPPGTQLPPGMKLPNGAQLQPGTQLPPGMKIPPPSALQAPGGPSPSVAPGQASPPASGPSGASTPVAPEQPQPPTEH